jgi:hypothetical protein
MRLTDHTENPILSPCLAWFGGGGRRGPSEAEKQQAARDREEMLKRAEEDRKFREQQIAEAKRQAEQQRKERESMTMQMAANAPAPGAQVDPGSPQDDIEKEILRRKGMKKSILAGESSQAPITTGYSTLG